MTRISAPGNERGFVLLDALLCLFITGIILGIVLDSQAVQRRVLAKVTEHTAQIIEERNRLDGERTGIDKEHEKHEKQ